MQKVLSVIFMITVTVLLIPQTSFASHIVGGELSYRCLGNNQWELTLVLFRDCENANPEADFDNPAQIGFFKPNGDLAQPGQGGVPNGFVLMYLEESVDTLPTIFDTGCEVLGEPVCIEQALYRDTFTINAIPDGGLYIRYIRCCRNTLLNNIQDPTETGATYEAFISETAFETCNSNPILEEFPFPYMCVNAPTCFLVGGIDPDGDSLAFRLCAPLAGASIDNPLPPIPPEGIPEEVVYEDGFSPENPFGPDLDPGNQIDTTVMTEAGDTLFFIYCWVPLATGTYVISYCVEEYRDGELIGLTRRDFEITVRDCQPLPLASYDAPGLVCGERTVDFDNNSTPGQYQWYFDFEGDTTLQSTEENPSFTFPDTGTYEVVLITSTSPTCQDTFSSSIRVVNVGLEADFDVDVSECTGDSIVVNLIDQSSDTVNGIVEWNYDVYLENDTLRFNVPDTTFIVFEAQWAIVDLTIIDAEGCTDFIRDSVFLDFINISDPNDGEIIACTGDTSIIKINNLNPGTELTYTWEPNDIIIAQDSNCLTIIGGDTGTTLYYTVSNISGCTVSDSIVVISDPDERVAFDYSRVCGSLEVTFINMSDSGSYFWDFGDGSTSNERDPIHVYDTFGRYDVTLTSDGICSNTITREVVVIPFESQIPDTILTCFGGPVELNPLGDPELVYNWSPGDILDDPASFNPTANVDGSTTVFVTVTDTESDSCMFMDTVFLFVPPPFNLNVEPLDTTICSRDSLRLSAEVDLEGVDIVWTDDSSNVVGLEPDLVVVAGESDFYVATASDSFGCEMSDTVIIDFTDITVDFTIIGSEGNIVCESDTVKVFITINGPEGEYDIQWMDNPKITTDLNNDTVCVVVDEDITLSVDVTNDSIGCTVSESFNIQLEEILLDFEILGKDTSLLCESDTFKIVVNTNIPGDYIYMWEDDETVIGPTNSDTLCVFTENTTTYTVTVIDTTTMCEATEDFTITIEELDVLVSFVGDSVVCEGDTIKLRAEVTNAQGNFTFEWDDVPGIIGSNTDDTVCAILDSTTNFVVTVRDTARDCEATGMKEVSPDIVDLMLMLISDPLVCEGDTIKVWADVMGYDTDTLFFDWEITDGVVVGDSLGDTICVFVERDANFKVTVTTNAGCVFEDELDVSVIEIDISAEADPSTIKKGLETQLFLIGAQPDWDILWIGPGIDNPRIENPIAMPDDTVTYVVQVTDENGCMDTAQVTVNVMELPCEPPFVFMPNAFTPNGDGINDVLFVRGLPIIEIYLIIYDRWGEKVFETRDKDMGWDGTYRGEPIVAPASFGYYLEVICEDGTMYNEKGDVNIIK